MSSERNNSTWFCRNATITNLVILTLIYNRSLNIQLLLKYLYICRNCIVFITITTLVILTSIYNLSLNIQLLLEYLITKSTVHSNKCQQMCTKCLAKSSPCFCFDIAMYSLQDVTEDWLPFSSVAASGKWHLVQPPSPATSMAISLPHWLLVPFT